MTRTTRTPLGRMIAAWGAASLVGCASAPKVSPPPPPRAAPAMVTMAPIANPHEPAAPRRDVPRTRRPDPTPTRRASSKPASVQPPPPDTPSPTAAPPPSLAAPPHPDPVAAAQLRARGLEALNQGSASQAVALLSQASRLDPGNVLIHRDLERAQRIARAVSRAH